MRQVMQLLQTLIKLKQEPCPFRTVAFGVATELHEHW